MQNAIRQRVEKFFEKSFKNIWKLCYIIHIFASLNTTKHTMKVSEFAKKCGVHDLTVRRWIKEGKIVATKVPIKPFVLALDIADEELKKILIKKPKQDGE